MRLSRPEAQQKQKAQRKKKAAKPEDSISPAENQRFETCKEKLQAAQQLGVLYDLSLDGVSPRVVVGPTFFEMPIDGKQGVAETVNCFLMAGRGGAINFDLLDWRTGNAVGHYSWGRLSMN